MASLTNNVNRANVLLRWEDWVANYARRDLVWGTEEKPFAEAPDDWFGGRRDSPPRSGAYSYQTWLGSSTSSIIQATRVRTALIDMTTKWTHMKNMRARRYYNSQGTVSIQIDTTAKAYQPTSTRSAIAAPSVPSLGPREPNVITRGSTYWRYNNGLEEYFEKLRVRYVARREAATDKEITVCHYSCHYSCHTSRGRR